MKYRRKYWGWTLLFFVLISFMLVSCSAPEDEQPEPGDDAISLPTIPPISYNPNNEY